MARFSDWTFGRDAVTGLGERVTPFDRIAEKSSGVLDQAQAGVERATSSAREGWQPTSTEGTRGRFRETTPESGDAPASSRGRSGSGLSDTRQEKLDDTLRQVFRAPKPMSQRRRNVFLGGSTDTVELATRKAEMNAPPPRRTGPRQQPPTAAEHELIEGGRVTRQGRGGIRNLSEQLAALSPTQTDPTRNRRVGPDGNPITVASLHEAAQPRIAARAAARGRDAFHAQVESQRVGPDGNPYPTRSEGRQQRRDAREYRRESLADPHSTNRVQSDGSPYTMDALRNEQRNMRSTTRAVLAQEGRRVRDRVGDGLGMIGDGAAGLGMAALNGLGGILPDWARKESSVFDRIASAPASEVTPLPQDPNGRLVPSQKTSSSKGPNMNASLFDRLAGVKISGENPFAEKDDADKGAGEDTKEEKGSGDGDKKKDVPFFAQFKKKKKKKGDEKDEKDDGGGNKTGFPFGKKKDKKGKKGFTPFTKKDGGSDEDGGEGSEKESANILRTLVRGGTDDAQLISGLGRRRIARATGQEWMPGQADLAKAYGLRAAGAATNVASGSVQPLGAVGASIELAANRLANIGASAMHYTKMDELLQAAVRSKTPHRVTPGWRGKSLANHALKYDRPLDSVVYGGSPRNTERLLGEITTKSSSAGASVLMGAGLPAGLDIAALLKRRGGMEAIEMNIRKALAGKGEVVLPGFDWPILAGLNPNRKSFKALRSQMDIPLNIETNSASVARRAAARGVPVQVISPETGNLVTVNQGAMSGSQSLLQARGRADRALTNMFGELGSPELAFGAKTSMDQLGATAAGAGVGALGAPALEDALRAIFTPEFSQATQGSLNQMGNSAAFQGAAKGGLAARGGQVARDVAHAGGAAAGKGIDGLGGLLQRLQAGRSAGRGMGRLGQRAGLAGLLGAGAGLMAHGGSTPDEMQQL